MAAKPTKAIKRITRLNEANIEGVLADTADGWSQRRLARIYGVSHQAISQICSANAEGKQRSCFRKEDERSCDPHCNAARDERRAGAHLIRADARVLASQEKKLLIK